MNRTLLAGHLTKDPELKYLSNNTAVATFTVAVNRQFTNAQGEREADYINVVVFRKQAENVKKYCLKGSLVGIDGRIQTRSYDNQDGKKVYVTEVVADNVTFLGSKQNGQTNNQAVPSQFEDTRVQGDVFATFGEDFGENVEINDSDLAF